MLYYPQLLSGAIAQFPIVRREYHRTVTDTMPDGTTVRIGDPGAGTVRWQLSYSHLTSDEFALIDALFEAAQGQLNTFAFLDPTDNLLLWSTDLTNSAWTTDPLLTVTGGQADPSDGTGAFRLTNNGQAAQGLTQSIAAPSSLTYCFSLFLSAAVPVVVTLVASDSAEQASLPVIAGPLWNRVALVSELPTLESSISLAIELPPGAQVIVYGLQVEPQPSPSLYKATTDRSGVYPNSRFATDSLTLVTTGVNQNSAVIELMSTIQD